MKKASLFMLLIVTGLLFSCENESKTDSFQDWYESIASEKIDAAAGHDEWPDPFVKTLHSPVLPIDTIFRSMEGPYATTTFAFGDADKEDLVWLTGYVASIKHARKDTFLSDGFLCHNNLNILNKQDLPWKVKTKASKTRLFTLTEGQVDLQLPEGFGIPFPAGCKAEMVAQVLNHNYPDLSVNTRHQVDIKYIPDSRLEAPLIPLYQQAVFVTKQVGGPEGHYGEPIAGTDNTDAGSPADEELPDCGPPIDAESYNPFQDGRGRKYTGHWRLPTGPQLLKTEVTPMLGLRKNTRVHYIGVHVHPFAEYLALRDITKDTVLFKANVINRTDRTGIKKIGHYSSREGMKLYKDHRYELIASYNCTDSSGTHTAMATMFLYLRD